MVAKSSTVGMSSENPKRILAAWQWCLSNLVNNFYILFHITLHGTRLGVFLFNIISKGSSDLVQYLCCMTSPQKTSYTVLYHCIMLLVEALESALVLPEETLWY